MQVVKWRGLVSGGQRSWEETELKAFAPPTFPRALTLSSVISGPRGHAFLSTVCTTSKTKQKIFLKKKSHSKKTREDARFSVSQDTVLFDIPRSLPHCL